MQYLVSIIIPTYNRVAFLGESIDSITQQTYSNWECIVVDDGSEDTTEELLDFYCNRNNNIFYYKRPAQYAKGASSCRNFGFNLSKGKYIMWLDDDDILHKDKLKYQLCNMNGATDIVTTCAWGRFTSKQDLHLKNLKIYKNYQKPVELLIDYGLHSCFFPSHVFLQSKDLVNKAGLWRTDLSLNDDGEFFCRIILASNYIKFTENTFVQYRHHSSNRESFLNSYKKGVDGIRSWKLIKNHFPKSRRKESKSYINGGFKYIYTLLKNGGYRTLIFRHIPIFKHFLLSDLIKKIRSKIWNK